MNKKELKMNKRFSQLLKAVGIDPETWDGDLDGLIGKQGILHVDENGDIEYLPLIKE